MYCDGTGVCTSGKKANGATSTVAADCGSNFCVEDVLRLFDSMREVG